MTILARGLNIAGTFNPLPGLSYNLVPSIEVRRRSTSIVYGRDSPDDILSISVDEFAAEKFGGAWDNYYVCVCICTREERRRDGTSKERRLDNGHLRASFSYKQPIWESVCGWHDGHRGEFEDGGEMESSGWNSCARGHGICVQERDSVIVFILERVAEVTALAESGADANVVVREHQLQDNTTQLQ